MITHTHSLSLESEHGNKTSSKQNRKLTRISMSGFWYPQLSQLRLLGKVRNISIASLTPITNWYFVFVLCAYFLFLERGGCANACSHRQAQFWSDPSGWIVGSILDPKVQRQTLCCVWSVCVVYDVRHNVRRSNIAIYGLWLQRFFMRWTNDSADKCH